MQINVHLLTTRWGAFVFAALLALAASIAFAQKPAGVASATNKDKDPAIAGRCVLPPMVVSQSPPLDSATLAQRRLGQGVAFFDAGRYVLAMQQLKSALSLGLRDASEKAIANKYLGFYYCIHKVRDLCEQHLEKALTVAPPFDLDPGEKTNPQWASAYQSVAQRLNIGCEAPPAPVPAPPPAALTATTTASVTPKANEVAITTNVSSPTVAASASAVTVAPVAVAASPTAKKSKMGTVQLDVRPWGEVFVNNKRQAITPPSKTLTLSPGVHRIEIKNSAGTPLRATVTLQAGETALLSHRF
jgi:hypothetical protein